MAIIIKELVKKVDAFHQSEEYQFMQYGVDYYRNRNTAIMERKKEYYVEGLGVTANPYAANHKLPSGFFRKIVDQKVQYLLGNGITFAEDNKEALDEYFKHGLDEFVIDAGTEASKKAVAYAYAYKDNGKLKFTLLPSEQVTPILDDNDDLQAFIRRFEKDDKDVLIYVDDTEVTRWEKKKSEASDKYTTTGTYGHFSIINTFNGEQVGAPESHSFSRVPLIPLYNNKERVSDLYGVKPHIDIYDLINSDFANNIDDMQDAYFELKGFSGDTNQIKTFMEQLKQMKAVPTPLEGGVEAKQLEIPVEARSTYLQILEHNIYKDSMSVDVSKISGGSVTNVVIKAMFTDLDLKADKFESEIRKFLYNLIDFINANDNKSFVPDFKFERSTVMNKAETTETVIKLTGILSDETIMELLPYDIDYEQEKERLDAQNEVYLNQFPEEEEEAEEVTDDAEDS